MQLGVVILSACALAISYGVARYIFPQLIKVAFKLHILDNPDDKLKRHKEPTPYLGGLGIYLGFITALALVCPIYTNILFFILGTTLLLFIGLVDDLVAMQPSQKFIGQCIAALCFLKGGFYLKATFLAAQPHLLAHAAWLTISYGWILSVINAFNLVDVMDGLATTLALFAAINFMVIAYVLQSLDVVLLLASFIGALIAFLAYNKPPARMYLGDAGSLFIGGFLATIPFMLPWGTYTVYGYIVPVIILLIPLLEVGTLIVVRLYKRIPFYQGSPDHFSIYLQKGGWSKITILRYCVLCSLVLGCGAVLFVTNSIELMHVCFFLVTFVVIWYSILIKAANPGMLRF